MSDILNTINATKFVEIAAAQALISPEKMHELALKADAPRDFTAAITRRVTAKQPTVIAEIKKASPSKGILREHFAPADIARQYEAAGAACLSVLTDETYFQGHSDYLKAARAACALPVLRKDFIVDAYQIDQARAWGADAILLIAASLTLAQMQAFEAHAFALGMGVLVEVHNETELQAALQLNTPLLGINNRNLHTFEVTLQTTLDLMKQIPAEKTIVTESGILKPSDVLLMQENDVHAFLVGEAFMRAPHAGEALSQLFNL
ncbi:Indole-3-glycerol phosphate synthase [Ephemeroptericola cinctiostellae]|uniref:Indole-3-glycerol phosphate synthase n=1 Tax=Ephemeroptericola cinctiostellae TaxID=2268024 RepID=A0A345DAN7_9BURK|nr:indole-3-glycerol phosphate synthase TrpC [Ephemeroptericola cinctiostellae]AXF85425.1 Indole-3-glycerol phosphate synthase [Ephemeroptericola cinctiostellae]